MPKAAKCSQKPAIFRDSEFRSIILQDPMLFGQVPLKHFISWMFRNFEDQIEACGMDWIENCPQCAAKLSPPFSTQTTLSGEALSGVLLKKKDLA